MEYKHFLIFFLLLTFFSIYSYAQLGEQAGQPFFNVSVGSSQTINYSIFNSGSTPIGFQVILPTLNTIPNNATPTISVTPMNGTLAPNSQQKISVTVYMPAGDKPYLKWQGVLQVVETTVLQTSGAGMGATIRAGVAKIVTIESAPPKPIPIAYYIASAAIAVLIIAVAAYLLISRNRSKNAKRMAMQRKAAMAVKARVAAKKGSKKAKRTPKRKAKGRSAKRSNKSASKRRSR
ncbi:MAG: hypothetical protein ACP5RM_03170 [Candidatus Micrarchaeia archaeon]